MGSVIDKFSLRGRSALVTGGSSGIGLACVEALAEGGAAVTIAAIHGDKAEDEAARLRALGHEVRARQLDVTREDEVRRVFDAHAREFGGLDVAFANAGGSIGRGYRNAQKERLPEGQVDSFELQFWHDSIALNLHGTYYTIRHAARLMKAGGKGGSIVVTTSNASTITVPVVAAPYMAAKAGAAHLVRQMARELAEFGIRVNAIAPGSVVTNIGNGALRNPEVQAAWARGVPLGRRMGRPEQFGPLALFLASDASDFITGVEITADGGVSLEGMPG